jgi:hypothetical protein
MRPESTHRIPKERMDPRRPPRPSFFLDKAWPALLFALALFKLADWRLHHDPSLLLGGIGFVLLAAGTLVHRSPRMRKMTARPWPGLGLAFAGLALVMAAIVLHRLGPVTGVLAAG